MRTNRTRAVIALAAAGVAWGASVPLSKVALTWLGPAWLTSVRFAVAAAVLLLIADRRELRAALRWPVLAWGALGYGGSVLVQNAGVEKTSVTHAALLIGAGPVLVAVIAALWSHAVARPIAWAGFALSLAGVAAITAGGGTSSGASGLGDGLVLAATLLAAAMTVAQGGLLAGRDPVAVTAVQFAAAALASFPFALGTQGIPAAPHTTGLFGAGPVLAVAALALVGTAAPFTLFAYGQRHVSAELAGAFLNLEPLVGVAAGVVFFANPAGPRQLAGGVAILAGIILSSFPALRDPDRNQDRDRDSDRDRNQDRDRDRNQDRDRDRARDRDHRPRLATVG
jgi:O-acetylserine/cysteine efflux transporter